MNETTIEFITIGGITVTADWANTYTSTPADAEAWLSLARDEVRRDYFSCIATREVAFILAKYPELA